MLLLSYPGKADQPTYLFETTFFLYVPVYLYYIFLKLVSNKEKAKTKYSKYGLIMFVLCMLVDITYIIVMN